MAMLVLPEVFERTWGRRAEPFWPAAVARVRESSPRFLFMAEVYWDLEWTMQQQGFDYAYDKRLYDRLREGAARSRPRALSRRGSTTRTGWRASSRTTTSRARRRPSLRTRIGPRRRSPSCLPGCASSTTASSRDAGRRSRRTSCGRPRSPSIASSRPSTTRLLGVLRRPVVRNGRWQLLECAPAWEGNASAEGFVAFAWEQGAERLLVTVNQAADRGQCYVRLPFGDLAGRSWRLQDELGSAVYDRDGSELQARGLYLDEPPWQASVFSLELAS